MFYIDGGGRRFEMTGHHYPGQPWVRYAPAECFDLDEGLFTVATRKAGWQIDGRPSKQGMAYHYRLVPAGYTPTAGIYTLNATDHETVERHALERRMVEMQERSLAGQKEAASV